MLDIIFCASFIKSSSLISPSFIFLFILLLIFSTTFIILNPPFSLSPENIFFNKSSGFPLLFLTISSTFKSPAISFAKSPILLPLNNLLKLSSIDLSPSGIDGIALSSSSLLKLVLNFFRFFKTRFNSLFSPDFELPVTISFKEFMIFFKSLLELIVILNILNVCK